MWGKFIHITATVATKSATAKPAHTSRVGRGTVWVSDDLLSASLWERRDGEHDLEGAGVWREFRAAVAPEVWARIEGYDAALAEVGPLPPYWYLGVLATHPTAQRRGLAQAVIAPALALADAEGLDCWLETSKPANTGFYERRGFTDRIEVAVPSGPLTWWMRHPARPASG